MKPATRLHWVYGIKSGAGIGAVFICAIDGDVLTGRQFDPTVKDWKARDTYHASEIFSLDRAHPLLRDALRFRYRLKVAQVAAC
jgi:hypothetical protein